MPVSWRTHKHPVSGLIGCTVGIGPSMYVGAFGDDIASALHAASAVAGSFAQTLKSNPALAAVMPPGTGAILSAVQAASGAVKAGATPDQAAQQVAQTHGPKAAGLVSSLLDSFGL